MKAIISSAEGEKWELRREGGNPEEAFKILQKKEGQNRMFPLGPIQSNLVRLFFRRCKGEVN